MIKYLAIAIVLYTAVLSVILFEFFDAGLAVGSLLGGLTVLASMGGLALHWHLIFVKKNIAFVLLIIIFKYLILIGLLWSVYSCRWISPIGFCLGLTALLFSLLVAIAIKRIQKS